MTFQIAARCADTGRFGVAITTRPMGVGSRCPFIEPGVGLTEPMVEFAKTLDDMRHDMEGVVFRDGEVEHDYSF